MTLGKEVQLKHRAPVLAIQILDGSCIPVTSMSQSGMYKYISKSWYIFLLEFFHCQSDDFLILSTIIVV